MKIKITRLPTKVDSMIVVESLSHAAVRNAKFVEVYCHGEFSFITTRALASYFQYDGDFQYRAIDTCHVSPFSDGFVGVEECSHCGETRAIYSAIFMDCEYPVTIEACAGCHDHKTNEMVEEAIETAIENAYGDSF